MMRTSILRKSNAKKQVGSVSNFPLNDGDETEIDVSLILLNLSLSYEERIRKHDEALRFMDELRAAGKRLVHAKSR